MGSVGLEVLEEVTTASADALDNSTPAGVRRAFREFAGELELIRFVVPRDDQPQRVRASLERWMRVAASSESSAE